MANSRAKVGNGECKPGIFYNPRKKKKKTVHKSKRHRRLLRGAPPGQIWDNLSSKINNHMNRLNQDD